MQIPERIIAVVVRRLVLSIVFLIILSFEKINFLHELSLNQYIRTVELSKISDNQ
jgi:hypothetical protein